MMDVHSPAAWQALIALLWPFLQQWLKDSKFPWLTRATLARNYGASALVAVAAALGLHYSLSGSAAAGWTISLAVPPASVLEAAALQYLAQHLLYKTGLPEKLSAAVVRPSSA